MKNALGLIDWQRTEDHAKEMDSTALRYAINDIRATLGHADDMDRQDGGDRGGYYRDELSVYVKELKSR